MGEGHDRHMPPMSIDDVGAKGFEKLLIEIRQLKAEETAWAAYPVEMRESQKKNVIHQKVRLQRLLMT